MKRPRFSIRWMMTLVAAVAVFIGMPTVLWHHHISFERRAAECAKRSYAEMISGMRIQSERFSSELELRRMEEHYRLMDHYEALKLKYERAARRPWLPVEPDPPEPGESP